MEQRLDDATAKGKQEGIQIGEERGIQIGEEKGRKAEKIEVAKAMLADNMDVNTVARLTGLPVNDIEKLQKESIH